MTKTLVEMLAERDAKREQGNWTPACGGTEIACTYRTGRRLLYVYQASTGKHAYLDCNTDLILSDEEARLATGNY
jgi:hypothetical protein